MSRDRDASSSDIERARALTRRLEQGEKAGGAAAASEPGYIRFDAARFGAPATPALQRPPPAPPPSGPVEWGALIGWVRALAGADAVFLSDASGLLVALAGDVTHEHAEAMGSRLVLAFEHADRMEAAEAHATRFMAVDFGGVVVSGLRVDLPEGGRLVLGIAGPTALGAELRGDIERVLVDKARQT
ncbi:MAG TPA: hypothetical protein VF316_20020 [Polyangiaceae bacterium]